jgi:hypothetical protein
MKATPTPMSTLDRLDKVLSEAIVNALKLLDEDDI